MKKVVSMLLMGVILLSSGCVNEQMTADKIAGEIQKKQASITDYSATIYTEVSYSNQIQVMEYDYTYKEPGKTKVVIRSPEESLGVTTVCNGEKTWVYDPGINRVQVFELPEMQAASKIDYASVIDHYMNNSEITVDGVDTLEGRDTYIVTIHMKENGTENKLPAHDMRIWFDEETWMPLKIESFNTNDEENTEEFHYKVEYKSFKVNTGIDDDYFNFEIPENTEIQIISASTDLEDGLTLQQAQEVSSFNIMIPSYLPEGYELEAIYTNEGNPKETEVQEYATIIYSNGEDRIHITEMKYVDEKISTQTLAEGDRIYVNDIEGMLFTFDKERILEWNTGNLKISVDSTLEKKEIVKIAESIE